MASEQPPHLIILDLRLPDLDGFTVLDRLRAKPATADVPVIVCTSSTITPAERARLPDARVILSKASLTRDLMQRSLREAWMEPAGMKGSG